MDANAYLSDRVDQQLEWLGDSSRRSKRSYMRYRISSILLGALITILAPYAGSRHPWSSWIPLLLQLSGAGVAVSGSLLALNQHQENWLRYRQLKENLEREKLLYLTESQDEYAVGGTKAFHQFVRRAEAIMSEERTNWTQQRQEYAKSEAATIGKQPSQSGDLGESIPPKES
jgi:hypothetical protein